MCYMAIGWVVAAAITAYAGHEQAQTQKAVGKYEADVAKQNAQLNDLRADQARTIGAIQEDQHRAKIRQMAGAQRAQFAANGIDLGSGVVQDMLDQTYTMGETDALTIRFNAMNEAWGYQTEATNQRNQARFAKWRGNREARNTYLTTAASIASSFGGSGMGMGGGAASAMSYGNSAVKTGANYRG